MAYTIQGKLLKIMDVQTFPSGFSKREIVIETEDKYPQPIKLDLLKEKTDLVDGFKEGENVTASFDLRGREYNGRYFVDLTIWKIDRAGEGSSAPASSAEPEDTTDYGDDDVPF